MKNRKESQGTEIPPGPIRPFSSLFPFPCFPWPLFFLFFYPMFNRKTETKKRRGQGNTRK